MARKVRTAEGSRKYNLPIGSVIGTGKPDFRVTKVVVHHADDGSRAVVASAGPVKRHVTTHKNKDSANDHLADLLDDNPHLVHLFHNINGRLFRLTGDDVHAQMGDGSFQHVGSLGYNARDQVLARPHPTWARRTGLPTRAKAHDTIKDAMDYLTGGVDAPYEGDTFAVTKRLSEVLKSVENRHMRPLTDKDERRTHDGQPIPPAWTQVEIAKDPTHHLQARGRDDLGRIQALYSLDKRKSGLVAKHERGRQVAKAMPKLDRALTSQALMRDDTAAAVFFMRHTGARVDSSGDGDKEGTAQTAKGIHAYGTTSLEARHIKVNGDVVKVDYIGKNGMRNTYRVHNRAFAQAMAKRLEGKGPRDRVFNTSATRTAAFIKKSMGIETDRPNHDLRTHFASSAAAKYVQGLPERSYPKTEREHKKMISAIGDKVGGLINDTRSVTLGSYIDPEILRPLRKHIDGGK